MLIPSWLLVLAVGVGILLVVAAFCFCKCPWNKKISDFSHHGDTENIKVAWNEASGIAMSLSSSTSCSTDLSEIAYVSDGFSTTEYQDSWTQCSISTNDQHLENGQVGEQYYNNKDTAACAKNIDDSRCYGDNGYYNYDNNYRSSCKIPEDKIYLYKPDFSLVIQNPLAQ